MTPTRPLLLVAGALLALTGCSSYYCVASDLDEVDEHLDEWGTASVSEVLLVKDQGQFRFEFDEDERQYFLRAKTEVQGAVSRFYEQVLEGKTSVRGTHEEGSEATDLALPGEENVVTERENQAKGVLSSEQFLEFQALLSSQPTLSDSDALRLAFSANTTERILNYLSNPTGLPADKVLFAGVTQVSCNPGWRTRSGYVADINVRPSYVVKGADGDYTMVEGDSPYVLGLFPLLESQTLELRNSEREQLAWLVYLSGLFRQAGGVAQVDQLVEYVERVQFDAVTRTPRPIVVSYSNGETFGFRLYPVVQALGAPLSQDSETDETLLPTSFPAAVFVICEREELERLKPTSGSLEIGFSTTTRWVPVENQHYLRTWTLFDPIVNGYLEEYESLTNTERLRVASCLDSARTRLEEIKTSELEANPKEDSPEEADSGSAPGGRAEEGSEGSSGSEDAPEEADSEAAPGDEAEGGSEGSSGSDRSLDDLGIQLSHSPGGAGRLSHRYLELRRRYNSLASIALGNTHFTDLPSYPESPRPAAPDVDSVNPLAVFKNAETVVLLTGDNFMHGTRPIVEAVVVEGRVCRVEVLSRTAALVHVPAWSGLPEPAEGATLDARLQLVTSAGAVPQTLPINGVIQLPSHGGGGPPEVELAYDGNSNLTKIVVKNVDSFSGAQLLEALRNASRRLENVTVEARVSSSVETESDSDEDE
jgi:hypothetical protein